MCKLSVQPVRLFLAIFSLACFAQASPVTVGKNDHVANERPPLNAWALQKHWRVDCHQIGAMLFGEAHHDKAMSLLLNDPDQLQTQLQMCSMVHARFWTDEAPCNPFEKLLVWMKNAGPDLPAQAHEFTGLLQRVANECPVHERSSTD